MPHDAALRKRPFGISILLFAALLCLPLLFLALPRLADAQPRPERLRKARVFYKRGKAAFELGNFQKALKNYEKAYRVASLPGLLFNIGQCYRNLGELEKAVFSFRLYLRKVPKARNRDAVHTLIVDLDQKIMVTRRDEKRRSEIARRERERVRLEEDRRRREQEERDRRLAATTPGPKSRATPLYKKWWFWTLIGVAAAGAGAGVYFGTRSSGPSLPASPFPTWELP